MFFWILAFIVLFLMLGTDNADAADTVTAYHGLIAAPYIGALVGLVLVLIVGLAVLWWATGTNKQPPHPAYRIKQGNHGGRTVFRYFRWDMENQEWVFVQTYDHLYEATEHRSLIHVSDYVGDTYYRKDGQEVSYDGHLPFRHKSRYS